MKPQLAMVIDSAKCMDCKGCMVACKVANEVPGGHFRNWIKVKEVAEPRPGRGRQGHFQPGACMHCDKPMCVDACPTGATFKDPKDGTVKIDRALCIGCGNCIPACPYGARYRHPVLKVADKCDYCPERRERGLLPACVDTCPTKARVFGDIADPDSEAARLLAANQGRIARVVRADSDTKPNMFYLAGTAPADWPHKASITPPMLALTKWALPGVSALIGLAAAGVAAMAARRFLIERDGGGSGHGPGHGTEKEG